MFPEPKTNPVVKRQTAKDKLDELSSTSDVLVYGTASKSLKERDKELNKLVSSTLRTTIENQFGNTNKPLENFSLNMLQDLWGKIDGGKDRKRRKEFEDVVKQYFRDQQGADQMTSRIRYDNFRNIYSHIPAAHVALNIYKSSILSPESLSDEPINFMYDSNDDILKKIVEKRVNYRVIEKYELNAEMDKIVKEALIDGVSYRAVISIEKDMQDIMRDNKVLTEDTKLAYDPHYHKEDIKFYDSEISKEQTAEFNKAIQESAKSNIILAESYKKTNPPSEHQAQADLFIESIRELTEEKGKPIEYTGAQIGRFARDLINSNITIKSKYDFMQDYTDALTEGFVIDTPVLNEDGEEAYKKKDQYFLNGSKMLSLEPENVTPIKIGNITIGYIYTERDMSAPAEPMSVGTGAGGTANLSMAAPVSFGVNTYGTGGLNNPYSGGAFGNAVKNPLGMFGASQTGSNYIVDLFINGLGKKLNKNFIRNNKDLKDLIHELLREKYITQKRVAITFFSSDDIVETRVKPLFEGSEFFAKLYLAELTNNITISLGRGMDRRMIKIPFGIDDDMYQTVQEAIRTFKTREFSMASIDETTISSLVRTSPGRYEDMYIPVAPDGTMGYDIDILPGMDNSKSSELLPQLRNQFLDSINIPAQAIDSTAETDFSRSIALRNVYFSKEIVDYQKPFNKTATKLISKLYLDEYKYNGNKLNEESNVNIDDFVAWFSKPYSLNIATTLETMQNVEQYATIAVSVIVDLTDPSNGVPAHRLKKKIFKDTMSYLPWDEWEEYYNNMIGEVKIETIKKKGKKGSAIDENDPNQFNPGGFSY